MTLLDVLLILGAYVVVLALVLVAWFWITSPVNREGRRGDY